MATSDEWSRVGFTGNPVTGDPGLMERVTKELRDLGDLAGRVSGGLDTLLTKAEDGGFEGRTADALRTYVKDELKTYMANINRSFEMAADATARYARALGDAQDRAENAADTVAALERVGGQPLADNDPEMTRARGEVDAERDAVQAEAKILEDALREAARLVSRPVKKPKKSFWKRFVSTFFKVLEIVALVITLIAAIIGGPLGLVAFGLGAVLFAKALFDYATGNGNALSLGLAFLGILFPSTKGLTTLSGLFRLGSSGAKALGGALSASGRLLFRGGRTLMSSPGRLLSLAGQGLVRLGGGLAGRAGGAFMALPRVLSKTPAMLGSALRFMGGFARGTFRQGWSALSRDFHQSTAFVAGNMATKLGVFTIMGLGRLTATALLPMRYSEIARFGYRGAARMGFIDRGLRFAPKGSGLLTRTGSLSGDLMDLRGGNLDRGGTLRPFDGAGSDRLAVPGTPEFNDTLDELADISVTPVTAPRTPGFSSLAGPSPVRMPGRLDDLGVRLGALDDLDTVGLPVGTVPGGQRLDLLTPVNQRLRLLDPTTGRVGDDLLPPPTALDELRELDALTGMERTPTGLLRPLDDLAGLSLDGRLGGLTESQVRQVLDGEIDLVRVTPDGVVLRVGKTDPIDVRVGLRDEVTIEVLGPADPRVPTWNATKGAEGLDDLGIRLDDLTRLIPDTGDGSRTARELLGLGPVRTDVAAPPATKPFTALTLRDIVTGGATGRLATERFRTWLRAQSAQLQLDTAGRRLGELDGLTGVPPLSRAQAELDLSAARLDLGRARIAFDRLGMNLDTVRRDVLVMTARVDGPAAVLPTGELRLLDDLGLPTGRWITMEPGQSVAWVLRTDSGVVPGVEVRMVDGTFTVTGPDGAVTRFGADGRPDRLAFAADRSVDIQAIVPAPVWRATDETLWRIGGRRPLDQIFREGFTVRDPLETNLDVMVRTGQPSAFVSTTTDRNLVWDGIYKFEIEASGGIDVGRTFERSMGPDAWRASGWASENEIAFPGGIASEFIRGAYRMDAQHNLLEWIPNPNFRGGNPLPELAADLRVPGEGASGLIGEGTPALSALDFQGLSLDDQLRLLDQLDLGGARTFDDLGSPNGLDSPNGLGSPNGLDSLSRADSLNDVGSQLDELGYLSDDFRFDRFDTPTPRTDTVMVDPADLAGVTGFRAEWQRTPLENGGFGLTDQTGDLRLVFDARDVRQFTDIRLPGDAGFVRFDADAGPASLPRIVAQDGVPFRSGATVEPVRGALGVVTGVRVQSLDGSWVSRFDLDGTRLSEQLTLSGPVGGPLTGSRLSTTFTQLPGGAQSVTYRLTVPGLGDGAFAVVRLDGDPARRLPGGFSVTDTATGTRFVFDRSGRFVNLPVDGAPTTRLDTFGTTVPETTARPVTALDGLGGNPSERLPLASVPGTGVLDDVAGEVTGPLPTGERLSLEDLAVPAPPQVAPPPPAPPHVAPPPVPTAAPPAHVPGAPVPTRPPRAVAPGFDTSFPSPSIGTESELSGFVVALPKNADRTFAFVSKVDTDEPLLMVTKDMSQGAYANPADLPMAQPGNWQTHTVELITYPSRLGDQGAIGARNGATQWLLDVFKERLGVHNHRPLESMVSPDGLYRLQVTSDRHVIAAGTGLELEGLPSVSMPTTQQQATIGVRAVDFGSRATQELRLLADHAHWYRPAFRDDDALRTALARETLDAPEQVENAYTYVKSVIDFTSDLVRRHGIPMEDWAGAPPYRGLTHPAVKNEWSVLPRTRPTLVLDSLSPGDRAVTLRLLREAPALGDESVWKAARQYILNGNEVAGRGINNATVGGERALLFEFRSLPDELKGAVPHEKAPVSVVIDPLAELSGNRAAGVRRINEFVSGPENRDAFADWYRTEFPRDPDAGRIHQNKGTDAILRMAAARHKAEWIGLRHPQVWQDITAMPVTSARPPVSAVPSAPPAPPRVGTGPLSDELSRPLTDLDAPHVPATDLPPTPRTPGIDLPRITQGPDAALHRITPAQDVTLRHAPAPELSVSPLRGRSFDSPLPPGPSVREVPLSGLDDVAGLRLRVTEVPATDAAPASVRVEVLDFAAQGGPARLPDASVTVREGGGFTATGPQGGVRWQFDAAGRLEHRELPLTGTDFSLRFTDDAVRPIRVTGPDGAPVPGATVSPVRDASGALSELTVRVPGPDGPAAVWRFEPGGLAHARELPLTLPGLDGPSGLGVRMTTSPGSGGTTTRVLELTGPRNLTDSFRLDPVGGTLSGRLPQGFTVTDTSTGARFHFDADGRLALRDLPAHDSSGFLRITEGAGPDTPPVRLDELGDLGSPRGFGDDLSPRRRALVDDLWNDLTGDIRPLSPEELNRVLGAGSPHVEPLRLDPPHLDTSHVDSPRTDTLSDVSDLSDIELDDLRARLDNLRQMNDEPPITNEPFHIPLSGVDDLADLDLRVSRLPATDEAPQGAYRLELTGRTSGATGPVRASDFTVELLDDSGRFAVVDPTGGTRFTFAPDGSFLGRQAPLPYDGLPQGMRLNVTTTPLGDGTRRIAVDVIGPPGTTGSIRFTGVDGALSERLPGGFTLTDTVTGSRFHFDDTGRLAFRDLPDPGGSGFLRYTEGAGPDTPPVRLDELGDLGGTGDLGDLGGNPGARFPLGSAPGHEALDGALSNAELARVFERTLDEASGLRRVPEGDPVDLSGIAGALDFLHAAPDSHAFQGLDLPGVQRLADEATASLDRFGLRPDLLAGQLREMTEQARLGLRRGAVGALGRYLDLPLATRLEDLRSTTPTGRVLGDFTVTPTPHGGPGGSRHTVRHDPSDLTLGFDANRSLVHQEVVLRGGPADVDGLKLGITGRSVDGGPWTPTTVDFVGARPADGLFSVSPSTELRGGLAVTDTAGTTRWHYGPEGVHAFRDVDLPGDRGVLRFEAGGAPQVLDSTGRSLPGFRAETLGNGDVALVPTAKGAQPMERAVFDPAGKLVEETVAVRVKGGKVNGQLWKIDHAGGTAVRLDDAGTPLTGRFDTAKVEKSATGQYKLIGEGKVTLFEREVLGNGHVLHLDLDRFGRARWTEFDEAGNRLRAGERIFDGDRRTYHDTLPYRWAPVDVLDVRTYTKALDGGLIRAEKNTEGSWVWTRFDKDGTEVLHGSRDWSWTRIGYKDTYLDPATGERAVAQRRGDVWPLNGYHGSRQYLEHPLLSGPAPGGMRTNPVLHTAVGPNNKPIDFIDELTEEMAQLADGGTLHVARISDQRLPAAVWYPRAGHGRFDGFFRNFVTGDSMFQVSTWTETAADGAKLRGVRLVAHAGRGWQDIDQFGRVVRETRTLENGNVVEVGRSATDPKQWAPAPKWNGTAHAYELPWLDTKSGTTGTRYVSADGAFVDVFEGADGNELLSLRSQGTGVREYLAENPARGIGADDVSGVWVDKNTQLQTTGRRDHWGELYVESHGDPRKDHWTWTATGPDGQVTEGVRIQNRGSLVHTSTWDDSFIDFERLPGGGRGDAVRERNATGDGSLWVDATRESDGTWSWRKVAADGTVESRGIRTYQDLAKGRWTDHIGTDAVRFRDGGRVREYAYTVNERGTPPPVESGRISVADLLSRSARHFEPDVSATVNREVWQEFDMGKVFRRRDPVEGVEGRFRESEPVWNQWREYQDGRLVAQRTITGRVWVTDAFGRWSNFDIAKLPEISSLPKVGGDVGLDGHRSWRLVGREVDFRGYTTELRGYNREFRDVFHEIWTGVEDGSSAAMPMWRHQLRKAVTDFTMGYLIEFGTSFAVSAITADIGNTKFDPITALQRAALNGAIGGGIRVGVNVAYDTTRLGYLKYGLTNLDQGQDWHRHPLASSDDWDGEWTVFENPTRWRSGSYDFFNNLGVGVLTGFVNNAVNAAVFGVNGQKRTGVDALEAGAWGAASGAFAGVTSGLLRYSWHAAAGSRVFHRGGPGELIWQIAEALGAGTLNYKLNNQGADIQPSRAFPPETSTPPTTTTRTALTTPVPAPTPPQPLTIDPVALPDGTELL